MHAHRIARRLPRLWKLFGFGGAAAWIVLLALSCGNAPGFGECVGSQALRTLEFAGDVALLAAAAWIGSTAARQTGRAWLGWIVGIGVFVATEGGLLLFGLHAGWLAAR